MSIKDRSRKLNTTKSRKISEKNDGDRERHHYMWLIMIPPFFKNKGSSKDDIEIWNMKLLFTNVLWCNYIYSKIADSKKNK